MSTISQSRSHFIFVKQLPPTMRAKIPFALKTFFKVNSQKHKNHKIPKISEISLRYFGDRPPKIRFFFFVFLPQRLRRFGACGASFFFFFLTQKKKSQRKILKKKIPISPEGRRGGGGYRYFTDNLKRESPPRYRSPGGTPPAQTLFGSLLCVRIQRRKKLTWTHSNCNFIANILHLCFLLLLLLLLSGCSWAQCGWRSSRWLCIVGENRLVACALKKNK